MTSCSCCREACRSAPALVNSSCQESQSAGYTISLNWRDGEHNGRIGFDPEIGLSWLDLTAGSVSDGLDAPHDRQELTHRLAGEIPAQEARRKTVTVLARIWARAPQEHRQLHTEALAVLLGVPPVDRPWLHWGMSLPAYPFFHDVASTVGRLLDLQGQFEASRVLRRMREAWGQRTTAERALHRLIGTFAAWGVICATSPNHHAYTIARPCQTSNSALALWFLECVLRTARGAQQGLSATYHDNPQLPIGELVRSPAAFPFRLSDHVTAMRHSDRFEITR